MFRGEHFHTIDEKGRLAIPAKFREALESVFEGPLVVTEWSASLIAFPTSVWRGIEADLLSRNQYEQATIDFRRRIYAPAQDCPLDRAGRILIPPSLRKRGKLDREVVLCGQSDRFEIWDAARHDKMISEGSIDDILRAFAAAASRPDSSR